MMDGASLTFNQHPEDFLMVDAVEEEVAEEDFGVAEETMEKEQWALAQDKLTSLIILGEMVMKMG